MKRLSHLIAAAFMAAVSFGAPAQTTTVNLSPFSPDQCEAAKSKLGDTTLKCAATFTPAPIASAITLSGVPADGTTSTSASITATVTPAAQVWCRLDAWAPIPCPQVFSLGTVTPLAPGLHKVDYYIGATAPDASKPAKTASWTITGTVTPPPPPPPPGTTPLAALKVAAGNPAFEGVSGSGTIDTTYTGQAFTGSDGLVRIKTNADGTTEQRTVQGDGKLWSGNRAELGWSSKLKMNPGADYWFAFAFKPITWGGGRQIFWQIHQDSGLPPSGCNGPTLELQLADGALQINSVSGTTSVWTCNSLLTSAAFAPAVGQWSRFVVHFRPGYQASQSPKTEVWKNGVLVYSSTNTNTQPSANDYPKYGIYKWDDSWSGVNQRAAQFSPLFYGVGADLKANADASLAGFK